MNQTTDILADGGPRMVHEFLLGPELPTFEELGSFHPGRAGRNRATPAGAARRRRRQETQEAAS